MKDNRITYIGLGILFLLQLIVAADFIFLHKKVVVLQGGIDAAIGSITNEEKIHDQDTE